MAELETPLLITFIGYAVIIFCVSYIATRSTSNISDYVLGGRQLSGPITALGAGASDMSSWLLMALPGLVYVNGLSTIWLPIALCVGAYCNWRFIAKRLRIYTEVANDSLTIPEFLCNRFMTKSLTLKIVTSLATIVFITCYSAAGFVSGAVLIQHIFPEVDYLPALFLSASVIVAYTTMGGFLAVSWLDFAQGSLMFVALIVVPAVTCLNLGGIGEALQSITLQSPGHLDPLQSISFMSVASLFAWGLGYFGQLHINTRFMAIRSVKELPIARLICMIWMSIALFGAMLTGLFGFLFYTSSPLAQPDTIFIVLAQKLFSPWIAGILLSAVSSAVMSSVSSQILMSASILVEDFYHGLFRKSASDRENLWASRVILFFIAMISVAIAAMPGRTIFEAVGIAWSGLGSSFGPTLIFSLFWRRMTKEAAIAGILSGMAIVLVCKVFVDHPDAFAGFEMLPGFIGSSMMILLVSYLTPPPGEDVLKQFDHTQALVANS